MEHDYNSVSDWAGWNPDIEKQGESGDVNQDPPLEKLSDSAFYRMYLREISARSVADQMELSADYDKLIGGDQSVMERIVDSWLLRIAEMAKFYHGTPVAVEDVIQEGNMGLWMALGDLPSNLVSTDMDTYLVSKIKNAMENYIREMTGDADQVQALVAKTALVYEAQEQLAKENGEVPSLRQLSSFTHIPAEEIQDILALLKQDEE